MKTKLIILIVIFGILIGGFTAKGVGIIDLVKKRETFNSNLDSTTKEWIDNNLEKVMWKGNTFEVSNNENTFKMKFCYTQKETKKRYCTKYMLIRDFNKEKIYCSKLGKEKCLEWSDYTSEELLKIRYVEKADEVLARVYRNNNKPTPAIVDIGNKTIKTNSGQMPI